MKTLLLALSLGLPLAGAAGAAGLSPTGLRGVVMRGPIAPVCVAEQPCSEPARDVTLLFSRSGRVAARAVTDAEGRYRVRLAPGLYTVRRPDTVTIGRRLEPDHARARAGRFARIDFSIDTGIR